MSTGLKEVNRSYGRCCMSPKFFDDFYDRFMGSSEAVKVAFANTNMARQKEMLRSSISYMLMYAAQSDFANGLLEKLAHKHGRDGLNIDPKLYDVWQTCLLETIAVHDAEF